MSVRHLVAGLRLDPQALGQRIPFYDNNFEDHKDMERDGRGGQKDSITESDVDVKEPR